MSAIICAPGSFSVPQFCVEDGGGYVYGHKRIGDLQVHCCLLVGWKMKAL